MKQFTKNNFCTSVREAIANGGWSSVKALNVVKSELGKMAVTKTGDDTMGTLKLKMFKENDVETNMTAKATMKPGTVTFEQTKGVNTAHVFSAWDDLQLKCEKLCPSQSLVIDPKGSFGHWLTRVASATKEELAKELEAATDK